MAKRTIGRVKISRSPKELLELANSIYQKHLADGSSSFLNSLQDIDITVLGPKLSVILAKHNEAEEHRRKMEEAYRERDINLPEVDFFVRNSASLLKAIFRNNPKKLGDWGIRVDDSITTKKKEEDTSSNI